MTVYELIEILSEMNPEAEVKIAYQPNYPLVCSVGDVVEVTTTDDSIVYITEGGSNDYLSGDASDALGW